jgi:hypothetical protein
MKKKRASKPQSKSLKSYSWRTLIGVAAVSLLLVGIVTAIAKKDGQTQKAQDAQAQQAEVATAQQAQVAGRKPVEVKQNTNRHYVTSNVAGEPVVLDRQTGQTRRLTPQEEQTLAAGIKQLVKPTADGLVQVRHANGMVSMDLEGHFQNVTVARKEADGSISQACVNDLESAASFFDIDPALLGISAPVSKAEPSSKLPIR